MFWRVSLLCVSVFVFWFVLDLSSHKEFASATIRSAADSNYFIECDGVDFDKDATRVSLRLIDKSRFPQFQTFRDTYPAVFQAGSDPKLSLETDLPFLKPDQVLMAKVDTQPALLFRPKPNNQQHEAIFTVWFQPLSVSEPGDRLEVDEVWLNFPTFPSISVKRKRPLSQEQDFWNEVHNRAAMYMNQPLAFVLLGLGCLGMVSTVGPVSKDLQILMFRWRMSVEGDAPAAAAGEKEEGDMTQGVILPPSWDKESISIVFRDLQDRPGVLSFFTQALVERFVVGQDDKTAKVRIEYLKTKLEELKITKELQAELDDLLFRQADLDVRRLQKEIEKGDLEHRRRTQNELRAAEHKRDILKVKAETAAYGLRDFAQLIAIPQWRNGEALIKGLCLDFLNGNTLGVEDFRRVLPEFAYPSAFCVGSLDGNESDSVTLQDLPDEANDRVLGFGLIVWKLPRKHFLQMSLSKYCDGSRAALDADSRQCEVKHVWLV